MWTIFVKSYFLKNVPNVLFSFFSNDKHWTDLTINDESLDGALGIRTRGNRMVGVDESTEQWRRPIFVKSFANTHLPKVIYSLMILSITHHRLTSCGPRFKSRALLLPTALQLCVHVAVK